MRVLLSCLAPRPGDPRSSSSSSLGDPASAAALPFIQSAACRGLLGLAQSPALRQTLAKLQVRGRA